KNQDIAISLAARRRNPPAARIRDSKPLLEGNVRRSRSRHLAHLSPKITMHPRYDPRLLALPPQPALECRVASQREGDLRQLLRVKALTGSSQSPLAILREPQ